MSENQREEAELVEEKPGIVESLKILMGASRGFWLVNLVNFGDGIAYFGFLALMSLFMAHNVGFSTHWSTISVSLFTGGVTIFMAIGGGTLSDRFGVRRALTIALAFILVGRVFLTLSPLFLATAGIAWISLFITAFGEGVIQPALYAGVKEYTDKRTATMGYAFLYSIMNLGIVAGEFLSPLVREFYASRFENVSIEDVPTAGITGSYWFFIGVTALILLSNLFFFTKKVEQRDRQVVAPVDEGPTLGFFEKIRSLPIMDLRFLFFIFILLPVRTLFAHQYLTMPLYVTRAFDASVSSRWEWVNGLNPLIIVVFVPVLAGLTQKKKVIDMMILGTLISALSTFLLATGPNLWLLLSYVVIFSLGEAFWSSRFLEYVAELAPANRVGIYMGIAGIPWFLAKSVTGFYSGSLLDIFVPESGEQSPGTLWAIYGAIALITPIGLILARPWLMKGEKEALEEKAAG